MTQLGLTECIIKALDCEFFPITKTPAEHGHLGSDPDGGYLQKASIMQALLE